MKSAEQEKGLKRLTRGEVLALLRVCWVRLMENGGTKQTDEIDDFLTYSMRLAEAFYGVDQTKDIPQVNAIGFHYEENEDEDEDEEE